MKNELTEFQKDCGALLELAQEIAVKHEKHMSMSMFKEGTGWINSNGGRKVYITGYSEPKNKAKFE